MVYNAHPPYEILQNRLIDFATMQKLRRFARYWDLVGNSGNFRETLPLIWKDSTPYAGFMRWSEWLHARTGRTDSIALARLAEFLMQYLTSERHLDPAQTAAVLGRDYQRGGRRDMPPFLKDLLPAESLKLSPAVARSKAPKRQTRHWA